MDVFPGVDVVRAPSGGFSIRIRGVSTLLGDKEPLYIVDGIPVQVTPGRGLDWLIPSEIERIDVLKNPAETSMYGRARRERSHRYHDKGKPLKPVACASRSVHARVNTKERPQRHCSDVRWRNDAATKL